MSVMDDMDAMARLSDWKPTELAGWRVGDHADMCNLGRVRVEELRPPSELMVRVKSGAVVRVGWRALRRVR